MAYTFNTELRSVAYNYAKALKVNVTKQTLYKEIEEHPYYPSLLSISDVFNRYKIENDAYQFASEAIPTLAGETPFTAFIKIEGVGLDFVFVTEVGENSVSYCHKGNNLISVPLVSFQQSFRNIIWFARLNEASGDPNYLAKRGTEQTVPIYKSFAVFVIISYVVSSLLFPSIRAFDYLILGSFVLKLAGSFMAILLLLFELDRNNSFVKNICSLSKKANCDAVLSSNASNIMGFTWADIGFIYFLGMTLFLISSRPLIDEKIFWITFLSLIASFFMPFSIYYQWRVVKSWCILCLLVQGILFVDFLLAIIFVQQISIPPHFRFSSLFAVVLPFIVAYCLLWLSKPVLAKHIDHDLFKAAYRRLQYNPDIFLNLLRSQVAAPEGWQNIGVDVGNPDADNVIIKICNPYCDPCNKAHHELEHLLENNDRVRLKIIYITRDLPNSPGAVVVKHFVNLFRKQNDGRINDALEFWYSQQEKHYENLATRFPVEMDPSLPSNEMELMSKWCIKAHVTHTPTIFVNGFRLPENYEISELKYIL